jgi:hypothetical protein
LSGEAFFERVQHDIESTTDRLAAEIGYRAPESAGLSQSSA